MDIPDAPLAPLTSLVYARPDEDPPHFPVGSQVYVAMDLREGGVLVTGRLATGEYDRELVAWEALDEV